MGREHSSEAEFVSGMGSMVQRRQFVWLSLVLPGVALLRLTPAAAVVSTAVGSNATLRTLCVFDSDVPAAMRSGLAARLGLTAPLDFRDLRLLEGDRFRFAQALLGERPDAIVGLTRHTDMVMLTGAAEEVGFRLAQPTLLGDTHAPGGDARFIAWRMLPRRGIGRADDVLSGG